MSLDPTQTKNKARLLGSSLQIRKNLFWPVIGSVWFVYDTVYHSSNSLCSFVSPTLPTCNPCHIFSHSRLCSCKLSSVSSGTNRSLAYVTEAKHADDLEIPVNLSVLLCPEPLFDATPFNQWLLRSGTGTGSHRRAITQTTGFKATQSPDNSGLWNGSSPRYRPDMGHIWHRYRKGEIPLGGTGARALGLTDC